jgi:hypothetical protein
VIVFVLSNLSPKHLIVKMSLEKNPCVFFDVSIDGDPVERIVIEVINNCRTFIFNFLLEIVEVCISFTSWSDCTLLKPCSFFLA